MISQNGDEQTHDQRKHLEEPSVQSHMLYTKSYECEI